MTLRRLVTGGLVGTLLVTLLGVAGGVYWLVGRHLERLAEERLRSEVFGDARPAFRRYLQLPLGQAQPDLVRLGGPGLYTRFLDAQGQTVDAFGGPPDPPGLRPVRPQGGRYFTRNRHERFLALEVPVYRADWERAGTLVVASGFGPSDDLLKALAGTLLLCGGAGFALSAWAARWTAGRLARPLEELAAVARAIAQGERERRAGDLPGPAETRSLAHDFDRCVDRLDAALTEQRRFVADASHELKTPLSVVLAMGEMLEQPDQGHHARAVRTLNREAARMQRLVTDLLLLSRLEGGAHRPTPWLELGPSLLELGQEYRLLHPGLELIASEPGRARLSREAWERVVRNLVDNALRYSERVRVRLTGARLEVEDEGPGLPEELLGSVFERFFRADPARARQSGGTGLGLSIVRSTVEQAGGRVWLENRREGGLRAVVELP